MQRWANAGPGKRPPMSFTQDHLEELEWLQEEPMKESQNTTFCILKFE